MIKRKANLIEIHIVVFSNIVKLTVILQHHNKIKKLRVRSFVYDKIFDLDWHVVTIHKNDTNFEKVLRVT
jgi:hypothetical protein